MLIHRILYIARIHCIFGFVAVHWQACLRDPCCSLKEILQLLLSEIENDQEIGELQKANSPGAHNQHETPQPTNQPTADEPVLPPLLMMTSPNVQVADSSESDNGCDMEGIKLRLPIHLN